MTSMARRLAALRSSLDLMPSPVRDRPGLLLRDPLLYTEDVIIVPPPLVPFLGLFDGEHDESDLAAALVRATGDIRVGEVGHQLADALGRGRDARPEQDHALSRAAHAREPGPDPAGAGGNRPT